MWKPRRDNNADNRRVIALNAHVRRAIAAGFFSAPTIPGESIERRYDRLTRASSPSDVSPDVLP
jgi:hypothetical protein